MSRHGDVTREWADGTYTFRLGVDEWRKIDERFDVGPYELLRRISRGTWKADYLTETVRIALRAGGSVVKSSGATDDIRINRLVREYVEPRLLSASVEVGEILTAILLDPVDDEIPKSEAAEDAPQSFPTEDSPSPLSMDGDQSSDTRLTKSDASPSGNSEPVKQDSSRRTAVRKSRSRQPEMISTP